MVPTTRAAASTNVIPSTPVIITAIPGTAAPFAQWTTPERGATLPAQGIEHRRSSRHASRRQDARHGAGALGIALDTRELHRSPNGDRWHLARDPASGRVFVRHEPNVSSGGRASDIEAREFLVRGGHGPEHQELLRLIGTLVEGGPSRA